MYFLCFYIVKTVIYIIIAITMKFSPEEALLSPHRQETTDPREREQQPVVERIRTALATMRENVGSSYHTVCDRLRMYRQRMLDDSKKEDVPKEDHIDEGRRRFVGALGAAVLVGALPKSVRALDRIDSSNEGEVCPINLLRGYVEIYVCDENGKNCEFKYTDPKTGETYSRDEALRRAGMSSQEPTQPVEKTGEKQQDLDSETRARMNTQRYRDVKERERWRKPVRLTEQERALLREQLANTPIDGLSERELEKLYRRANLTQKRLEKDSSADLFISVFSKKYGIPKDLIRAVITMESNGMRTALNLNSACAGYMGVSPIAARDVGRGVMDHLVTDRETLKKIHRIIETNDKKAIASLSYDEKTTLKTLSTIMDTALNIASGTGYLARTFHETGSLVDALKKYNYSTDPRAYAYPVIAIARYLRKKRERQQK